MIVLIAAAGVAGTLSSCAAPHPGAACQPLFAEHGYGSDPRDCGKIRSFTTDDGKEYRFAITCDRR